MTKRVKNPNNPPDKASGNPLEKRPRQMLQFARQPKKGKALLTILQSLEVELEGAYQTVREIPFGNETEEEVLQAVRDLENRRFELLSQIHGVNVQAYKTKA